MAFLEVASRHVSPILFVENHYLQGLIKVSGGRLVHGSCASQKLQPPKRRESCTTRPKANQPLPLCRESASSWRFERAPTLLIVLHCVMPQERWSMALFSDRQCLKSVLCCHAHGFVVGSAALCRRSGMRSPPFRNTRSGTGSPRLERQELHDNWRRQDLDLELHGAAQISMDLRSKRTQTPD